MKIYDVCNEYCIGCGLCKSELHTEMKKDENGYIKPIFERNSHTEEFLENVCPVTGLQSSKIQKAELWGEAVNVYEGYSTDSIIRKKASSGGMLTALAIFLLESGKVDGIIQVSVDENNPIYTKARVSTSKEQVLECCGSRYSISSPWINLSECIEEDKKYAAIGKPCDIRALYYLRKHNTAYSNIVYLLSFFCAGLPSENANNRLLESLGCKKEKCQSLTYRGNGWPGYATAIDDEGNNYQMEYSKAWGGILGRDINPYCRLCLDGIGESADISCGDGWYITEDGEPDFSERDGRNIVFARTELGENLLREAMNAGMIEMSHWNDLNQLKIIQKYQHTRKVTMQAKITAYKLMGKRVPVYNKRVLKEYAKSASQKEKARVFLGTIKRIITKKI